MDSPSVFITGALSGIGRATALAFAEERRGLVISGRRQDEGEVLATELRSLGTETVSCRPTTARRRGPGLIDQHRRPFWSPRHRDQ